jgi:DNA-binding CsgD family transcriptional regulator
VLGPEVAAKLVAAVGAPRGPGPLRGRLSGREREVLRLIAEGYSAPDIGQQLAISAKTVDTYKQRITDKIGVAGRPEYVRFALRVGLLTSSHADASHAGVSHADASHADASHAGGRT